MAFLRYGRTGPVVLLNNTHDRDEGEWLHEVLWQDGALVMRLYIMDDGSASVLARA